MLEINFKNCSVQIESKDGNIRVTVSTDRSTNEGKKFKNVLSVVTYPFYNDKFEVIRAFKFWASAYLDESDVEILISELLKVFDSFETVSERDIPSDPPPPQGVLN